MLLVRQNPQGPKKFEKMKLKIPGTSHRTQFFIVFLAVSITLSSMLK